MEDKRSDHFVDELLEAALRRERVPEPAPGLAEGILAGLESAARPTVLPQWAWGLAMAALLLAAGSVYVVHRGTLRVPEPQAVSRTAELSAATVAAPAEGTTAASAKPRAVPSAAASRAAPRRARFPSPAPLSEQEQLLLRYIEETPPEVLSARARILAELEPLRVEPLVILPLRVEPLPAAEEN